MKGCISLSCLHLRSRSFRFNTFCLLDLVHPLCVFYRKLTWNYKHVLKTSLIEYTPCSFFGVVCCILILLLFVCGTPKICIPTSIHVQNLQVNVHAHITHDICENIQFQPRNKLSLKTSTIHPSFIFFAQGVTPKASKTLVHSMHVLKFCGQCENNIFVCILFI